MQTVRFDVQIPPSTQPVEISSDSLSLRSDWVPPRTSPRSATSDCWRHRTRQTRSRQLADRRGQLITDTFTGLGMELTREIWISAEKDAVALRQKLRNRLEETIHLDDLAPLQCTGSDSLTLAGQGASDWQLLVQQRLKNSVPTSFRPGQFDDDYAHASKGVTEFGEAIEAEKGELQTIEIDSVCLISSRESTPSPTLLVGYLSQLGHCARIIARFSGEGDDASLEQIVADCEFDGCLLPPGGERTSQWVFVTSGNDPAALLADFADRVGIYHGVPKPPQPPPTVFCSWQYYGRDFDEKNFVEDLTYLEENRIPFDVFLIDECWDMDWGDWLGNELWPSGMKMAADRISALGYRPGIWTCPYLAKPESKMAAQHPEWLLRRRDGSPYTFPMDGTNFVLDPTYPGFCDHLEDLYRRMTEDWGFTYHKMDFMRAVFLDSDVAFFDPTATRLDAYRRALEAIRRGVGPKSYLSVCGGHYGGSLGLADSQRSGSDVAAVWDKPPALPRIKQNLLRTWMNRFWHADPDAMMVRRREQAINQSDTGYLSLGKFTDDEARTITLNQYLGGGLICLSEKFPELDADRLALYRHVLPGHDTPAVPLDYFEPNSPSQLVSRVIPRCANLEPWMTLAVVNWEDGTRSIQTRLSPKVIDDLPGSRFLVFEFFSQELLGLFAADAEIDLGALQPHASRLLRILPWNGEHPIMAGTELHFSGGGVEIATWNATPAGIDGTIDTRWDYPVVVTAAFPDADSCLLQRVTLNPGQRDFHIDKPKS